MFNEGQFYEQCNSGECVNCTEVLQYLKSFEQIILWGGSYLGAAVGRKLLDEKISITKYWDVRSGELENVNGISVEKPFESEYNRDTTFLYRKSYHQRSAYKRYYRTWLPVYAWRHLL